MFWLKVLSSIKGNKLLDFKLVDYSLQWEIQWVKWHSFSQRQKILLIRFLSNASQLLCRILNIVSLIFNSQNDQVYNYSWNYEYKRERRVSLSDRG